MQPHQWTSEDGALQFQQIRLHPDYIFIQQHFVVRWKDKQAHDRMIHGWGCDEPPQLRLSVIHLILGHFHGDEIKNSTD